MHVVHRYPSPDQLRWRCRFLISFAWQAHAWKAWKWQKRHPVFIILSPRYFVPQNIKTIFFWLKIDRTFVLTFPELSWATTLRWKNLIKNAALNQRLGLASRNENRTFRKRFSPRRKLKTLDLRFQVVDGKHFENGPFEKRWRHDNQVIFLTHFF